MLQWKLIFIKYNFIHLLIHYSKTFNIYIKFLSKVRLTDALLSSLDFKMGKDAELTWLNGRISTKGKKREAKTEDKSTNEENARKFVFL